MTLSSMRLFVYTSLTHFKEVHPFRTLSPTYGMDHGKCNDWSDVHLQKAMRSKDCMEGGNCNDMSDVH